jgi:hypothetical protein
VHEVDLVNGVRAPQNIVKRRWMATCIAALICAWSLSAEHVWALEKQGSAHGGDTAGSNDSGFDVSGGLSLGSALYNPSYAARPDNSGLALLRYAGHADIDLLGRKLSLPLDVNMFTDRQRHGAAVLLPTEFDLIGGVTSTWSLAPGAAIEVGSRIEHDAPVDRGGSTQTYLDARARLLYSMAQVLPDIKRALLGGDVTGWLALGAFAYNPTYFARPDNTGKALLRYNAHLEISIFQDLFAVGLDATMFTDRKTNALRPSELDFTPEVICHVSDFELHVAYERDMPVDRGGLVQNWLYMLLGYSFDFKASARGKSQ